MTDTAPSRPEAALPRFTVHPRLVKALTVAAAGVAAITLAALASNALVGTYRDQLADVQAIEVDAHPATLGGTGTLLSDARVQAFKTDPVFQTKGWAALTAASEKMMGDYFTQHDIPELTKTAEGIWWPGLKERATAALDGLHFDPARADAAEFAVAAGQVRASCAAKTLTTTEQRIEAWGNQVGPVVKGDTYKNAQLAVMPDVFRAGAKYFCS